ncbi:MAG: hypothetical protein EOO88_14880 [Pedobacter sp.]|nr:MAG: hypothetical protein EOO88_14880 [Pedobacter sp.]
MEITLAEFISRPYFFINNQLAELCDWFTKGVHLLASNYVIGGLVVVFLLLIGLLQMCQE